MDTTTITGLDRTSAFAVTLLNAQTSAIVPPEHEHPVWGFLDETAVEASTDVKLGSAATDLLPARFGRRYLHVDGETRTWLDETTRHSSTRFYRRATR